MDKKTKSTFRTEDIHLASFLKVKGATILKIGVGEAIPKRFYFEFENEELCEGLKYDYINGMEAAAKELFETRAYFVNELKNQQQYG